MQARSVNKQFNIFSWNTSLKVGSEVCIGGPDYYGDFFLGFITDLNAWNRPLTSPEVELFMDGCNEGFSTESKPNIIIWPLINIWTIGNNVFLGQLPESEICYQHMDSRQVLTRIMSYQLPFKKSRSLCSYLGGTMPLPLNEADFLAIFGKNLSSQVPNECDASFWLPIVQSSQVQTTWVDSRRETGSDVHVNYMPWATGQPNGSI